MPAYKPKKERGLRGQPEFSFKATPLLNYVFKRQKKKRYDKKEFASEQRMQAAKEEGYAICFTSKEGAEGVTQPHKVLC